MKPFIRQALLLLIVVGCVWYVLDGVNYTQLWRLITSSNVWLLAACVPVIVLSHAIRAERWRYLLGYPKHRVPFGPSFGAVMVGYAASTVIPRSGEVLRPIYLASRSTIPAGAAIGSVLVERVLDVLSLLLGIVLLVLLNSRSLTAAIPEISMQTVFLGLMLPAIAIIVLIILLAFTSSVPAWIVGCLARGNRRLAVRGRGLFRTMKQGTVILRSAHAWPTVIAYSFAMWALYAVPLWLVILSMPTTIGPIGYSDAAMLLAVISVGVTIAPTPGALGVYHGFAQTALIRLHQATADEGLGFALLAWVLNYGVAIAVGGVWFLADQQKKP